MERCSKSSLLQTLADTDEAFENARCIINEAHRNQAVQNDVVLEIFDALAELIVSMMKLDRRVNNNAKK